jgi:hypothetical protein
MINHVAVTNWSSAPDRDVVFTVEALRRELPAFCLAWGLPVPGIAFYDQNVQLASSEAIIVSAVDDDSQAGTAGYHTLVAGVPLFLWEVKYGPWVAFHELYETLVNPLLNRWAEAPDGRRWWVEACDACQADKYNLDVELFGERMILSASNWLRPEFFGLQAHDGGRGFDRMGVVSAPFTLRPGGYTETMNQGRLERLGAARPDKGRTTSRTSALRERFTELPRRR